MRRQQLCCDVNSCAVMSAAVKVTSHDSERWHNCVVTWHTLTWCCFPACCAVLVVSSLASIHLSLSCDAPNQPIRQLLTVLGYNKGAIRPHAEQTLMCRLIHKTDYVNIVNIYYFRLKQIYYLLSGQFLKQDFKAITLLIMLMLIASRLYKTTFNAHRGCSSLVSYREPVAVFALWGLCLAEVFYLCRGDVLVTSCQHANSELSYLLISRHARWISHVTLSDFSKHPVPLPPNSYTYKKYNIYII